LTFDAFDGHDAVRFGYSCGGFGVLRPEKATTSLTYRSQKAIISLLSAAVANIKATDRIQSRRDYRSGTPLKEKALGI
jgi:hypothetical protein